CSPDTAVRAGEGGGTLACGGGAGGREGGGNALKGGRGREDDGGWPRGGGGREVATARHAEASPGEPAQQRTSARELHVEGWGATAGESRGVPERGGWSGGGRGR